MSEAQAAPKLQKWPFYLADLVLSAISAYVLYRLGAIQGTTHVIIAVACLFAAACGAWFSIMPWLVEFRTHAAVAENNSLRSTLDQIQDLQKVADLIRQANSQWQSVQDASNRTVTAAKEITDKMKSETEEFMKFIENAHDQERAGLRLEVDKLRKMEGDWIKVTVQILDHVFALFRAAERSGQETLVTQLGQFQNACREAARRMGLVPFVPVHGEKYDSRGHQLPNPPAVVDENAIVGEVLATGFTYQGQLLRRSLVLLNEQKAVEEVAPSAVHASQPEELRANEAPEETAVFSEPPAVLDDESAATAPVETPIPTEEPEPKRSRASEQPGAQNELPL